MNSRVLASLKHWKLRCHYFMACFCTNKKGEITKQNTTFKGGISDSNYCNFDPITSAWLIHQNNALEIQPLLSTHTRISRVFLTEYNIYKPFNPIRFTMNYTENKFPTFLSYRSLIHIENTKGMCPESNSETTGQNHSHQFVNPIIIRNKWGIVTIIKESTNVRVYPNRIIDHAILEFKCVAHYPVKIEIAEISGKVVDFSFFPEESRKNLDLSTIPPGLYELNITDSAELLAIIRFIKYKN